MKVDFIDGFHLASCRMYRDKDGVFDGFSKNLYAGVGAKPLALFFVFILYAVVFVVPFCSLAFAFVFGSMHEIWICGFACIAMFVARASLNLRFRLSWVSLGLHPLAIASFFYIALQSYRWHKNKAVKWRGRLYAP